MELINSYIRGHEAALYLEGIRDDVQICTCSGGCEFCFRGVHSSQYVLRDGIITAAVDMEAKMQFGDIEAWLQSREK